MEAAAGVEPASRGFAVVQRGADGPLLFQHVARSLQGRPFSTRAQYAIVPSFHRRSDRKRHSEALNRGILDERSLFVDNLRPEDQWHVHLRS